MNDTSTVYLRPPVWALIAAVAVGGFFYLAGKNMEIKGPQQAPATITVSADAKVSAAPDIATLSFGIQTGRQPTAKAAIAMVQKNMQNIIDATKKSGIADKDITTSGFSLNPVYDWTTGGQIPRGFEASQTLTVKVRDLDTVGDVLTAATNAGANNAGGVIFGIDDPDAAQAEAREKAIDKAKEKATVLARSLGMSLGRITSFSEGSNGYYPPSPMVMMRAEADSKAGNLELPVGEQDITSQVTLTYELR